MNYKDIRTIIDPLSGEAAVKCSMCKDLISLIEQLKEIIQAQDELLACYRLNRKPPERVLDKLDKKDEVLRLLE